MFRQYFKQAIQMLKENRLTSVISILGTALSIAMILVVILQFQIKLVGFRPESNRDRMLYIMGIRADSRDSETRNSTAMSDGVVKECLYPLQTPRSGDGDSERQGDRLAVGPPAVRGVCDKVYRSRFLEGL